MNNENNENNLNVLCPNCKNNIPSNSAFCPFCGYSLVQNNPIPPVQNNSPQPDYNLQTTTVQQPEGQDQENVIVQPQVSPQPANIAQQPKTNKNLIYIIIGGVVLLIIVVVIVIFMVKGNNTKNNISSPDDYNKYLEEVEKENEKLSQKISYKAETSAKNELILFIKNDNSVDTDVDIEIEFYDANDKLISSEKEYIDGFTAGSEIVKKVYDTPDDYDNYKVYFDAKKTNYKIYKNQISQDENETEDEIIIQLKNNSNETIENIEVAIVFYKNNKVIDAETEFEYDIKSGRSANIEFSKPYDNYLDYTDYDNYKIFINTASTLANN